MVVGAVVVDSVLVGCVLVGALVDVDVDPLVPEADRFELWSVRLTITSPIASTTARKRRLRRTRDIATQGYGSAHGKVRIPSRDDTEQVGRLELGLSPFALG